MIIAITGGRGFIGGRLAIWQLAAGHRVRMLSRRPHEPPVVDCIQWHQADLVDGDEKALLRFVDGVDVLFHCAGEIREVARMESANRGGTERLAGLAAGRVGRWVQLSTAGVYGNPRCGTIDEHTPPEPADAYEASKLHGDEALFAVGAGTGMPWTVLRPTIVFGRDMPNSSVRGLVDAIRRERFFYIGSGKAVLPYVHVDDVVEALALLGSHGHATGQVFNLSDDVVLDEFVAEVCSLSGCRLPALRLPETPVRAAAAALQFIPGFPLTPSRIDALTRTAHYPADKIRQFLGYAQAMGWRAGLREILVSGEARA